MANAASTSSNAHAAPASSSSPRMFSETTIALQQQVTSFIDACYAVWKELPEELVGRLDTPEVLQVVKKHSTAFHCNTAGELDVIWVKEAISFKALKYAEAQYWSNKADAGPKYEQSEIVHAHRCDSAIMERINQSCEISLIAQHIYPFNDFWSLVQHHKEIWLASVFCSGLLCITKPALIVTEGSKVTRLFLDNSFVRSIRTNITPPAWKAFLDGHFDLSYLPKLCAPAPPASCSICLGRRSRCRQKTG